MNAYGHKESMVRPAAAVPTGREGPTARTHRTDGTVRTDSADGAEWSRREV
jgi:hypothetical protein